MTLLNTHERALPLHSGQSLEDYLIYLKHIALYKFVRSFCERKRVLDLGCGEGYGSDELSRGAHWVVAADYSWETVAHARAKYTQPNIAFVVCDAQQLPFVDNTFDMVISFEVIEHIPIVPHYLREIRRVAIATGYAILSTPNRVLRLLPFQKPWNRFHLREYDAHGLRNSVAAYFAQVDVRGITAIPAILEIEQQRVKQNPFIAYPKMVARLILPAVLYNRLRDFKHRWMRLPAKPRQPWSNQYTVDDFIINDDLNHCINLIAVGQVK